MSGEISHLKSKEKFEKKIQRIIQEKKLICDAENIIIQFFYSIEI